MHTFDEHGRGTTVTALSPDPAGAATEHTPGGLARVLTHVFFMFFTWQIFSPAFFGVTIYLECLVALINVEFWKWTFRLRIPGKAVLGFLALCALYLPHSPANAVAAVTTAITVLYLAYAYETKTFFMFRYLAISILVAIAQYYLLSRDTALALAIGPENLSRAVWGEHATGTYTNFYSILGGVSRVAGLSREGGFFASLLIVSVPLYFLISPRRRVWMLALLSIGLVISLSKVSVVIVPIVLIIRFRKQVDRLARTAAFGIYFAIQYFFTFHFKDFITAPGNGTFLDRFGLNFALGDMTTSQLLFGAPLDEINSAVPRMLIANDQVGAGISGHIVHVGLALLAAHLAFLYLAGIRSSGLIVVCLASLNLDLNTSQNFVSVAYFLALYVLPRLDTTDLRIGAPHGSRPLPAMARALRGRALVQTAPLPRPKL